MIATGKDWTADYDVMIFQEFEVRKNRPHLKTEPQQICPPPENGLRRKNGMRRTFPGGFIPDPDGISQSSCYI